MKLIQDMTEPELAELGKRLGKVIEDALPPGRDGVGKCGFFLVYSDTHGGGVAQYLANVRRDGGIKWMRETADRLESRQDVTR